MSTKETSSSRDNNKSISKNIRFRRELIDEIDKHKDDLIPFSAWVMRACEEKLISDRLQVGTGEPVSIPVAKTSGRTAAKSSYKYITPNGDFDNRREASDAMNTSPATITRWCDSGLHGCSREIIK